MRVLNKSLMFLVVSVIGLIANSQYPEIPLNTFQKPPVDLFDGAQKKLQSSEIADLFMQGKDISRLEPIEDKFWQNPSASVPAVDPQAITLKNRIISAGGVDYTRIVGGNREIGLFSLMVKMRGSSDVYGLTLGTQVHTSLVRAALLRKLGHYQNTPIFFTELNIEFPSKEKKDEFITEAFCGQQDVVTPSCINIDPFKSDANPQRPEPMLIHNGDTGLKLRSVYLEVFTPGIPSLIDGLTPATPEKIELFGQHRTYRALAAPFAVSDLGESLNRTEQESATVYDGRIKVKVNFGSDFRNTDHFDLRWIMRKMANLTMKDWDEILDAGQYPDACLKPMAYNGLIGRMNNMLKIVNINTTKGMSENPHIEINKDILSRINFNYNCGDLVRNGRLTRQFITGSPIRFAHELVDSPWGKGDIMRGLLIRGQSGLLKTGLALFSEAINKKIGIQKKKESGYILSGADGFDLIAKSSDYSVKGDVDGSRVINTGTIMGSEAPVQMVDNLSISLGASHSKLADLAGDVLRVGNAGVRVTREFTYVKPIGSMKEAANISILKILEAPSRLKDLAGAIEKGNIGEFLQSMKLHEVYFITDTISLEGTYGFSYGLGAIKMMGLNVTPSVTVGVNGQYNIIGQTMFMRTPNGFHVVIRRLDPTHNREITGGFFVSVKALFEFFHFNWSKTNARYLTDVFNLTYDPAFMNKVCPRVFAQMPEFKDDPKYLEADCEGKLNLEALEDSPQKRKQIELVHSMKRLEPAAVSALRDLIFDSDSSNLRRTKVLQDSRSTISNKVNVDQKLLRAFWMRQVEVKENQTIMFWEPASFTTSQTGGKPINVAVSRIGHLHGEDKVGFALNIFDSYVAERLGKYAVGLSQNMINPSGMPKGKAFWRVAETQTELTSHGAEDGTKMPPMAMLKYVWGGWSIKQADLNEMISQVNKRIPEYVMNTSQMIPDGVFNRVDKIDFYQLIVTLKIEQQGLENIRRLFISPELAVPEQTATVEEKKGFLKRLAAALEKGSLNLNQKLTGKFRPQDKAVFENIINLYGKEQYSAECNNDAMNSESPTTSTKTMYAGTEYSCLSKWVERLIYIARQFDEKNMEDGTAVITEILFTLDEKLPIQALLNVIGIENYRYGTNLFGFRAKDENAADAAWPGPVFGEPPTVDLYQNLLTGELARRHNLSPLVIDRRMMPF